ncbi:MAG: hypothetical protein LBL91_03035 [Lachnospiraceae bacterium]|jgi:ElaB/YqjD/DUF883 family membrane-anchored ribosome-binding protein|nr:hypothetical protein [Lachnospiraceae bacterium]
MVTIKDLSSVIDNNVLQDLFIQRNEIISNVSLEDKKNLKTLHDNQKQTLKQLTISLDNLPNCFQESKKQIVKCVENHIESSAEVSGYFDEKLYKSGVLDGISLAIESIKKDK